MRDEGKELRNLQLALRESNDKPIFYISRSFGHKYIVPRHQFEKLQRENLTMKKVLEIIENKGLDYHSLSAIKQAKDFEEFKELTKDLITKFLDYTKEEFDTVKRWLR